MSINAQNPTHRRILIAEDNREMRNTILHLVENDYEVVGTVGDGRALIDAAAELEPEIGVFDISMPIVNGIEAAIQIRKQGSQMKIVFLTVNEDTDFIDAAFDAGASGYVVKRQMASDLLTAIHEALQGRTFISSCCPLPDGYAPQN